MHLNNKWYLTEDKLTSTREETPVKRPKFEYNVYVITLYFLIFIIKHVKFDIWGFETFLEKPKTYFLKPVVGLLNFAKPTIYLQDASKQYHKHHLCSRENYTQNSYTLTSYYSRYSRATQVHATGSRGAYV